MGFFSKNNKELEKRSNEGNYNPVLGSLRFGGSYTYQNSKALKLAACFACIDLISNAVASLDLIPFTYSDLNYNAWKSPDNISPLYHLLNVQPNQLMSSFTMKKKIVTDMLLYGNAYILITRNKKGEVIKLELLNSPDVVIVVDEKNQTINYRDNVSRKVYSSFEIIHLLNFSQDGIIGLSTLHYAAESLGIAYESEQHAKTFFSSGGNLSGILRPVVGNEIDGNGKEIKEQFIASLNNSAGGKSGGVVALSSGWEYQSIAIDPKKSQLIENRQFNSEIILQYFGVGQSLIGMGGSTYGNAEQEQLAFLNTTLKPLLRKIEAEFFRKIVLPSDWQIAELKFNVNQLQTLDQVSKADIASKLFNCGVYGVNELRDMYDCAYPVVGGGRNFIPVNLQPTDQLIAENPQSTDPNKQIDNKLKSNNI